MNDLGRWIGAAGVGVLACAFGAGCSSLKDPYPAKSLFAIEPGSPDGSVGGAAASRPAGGMLRVRPLRVIPPYDGVAFVYRIGPAQYDTDYYNNFVAPPAALLTGSLAAWLGRAGSFTVIDSGGSLRSDLSLEGEVTDLHVDTTDKARPAAVVAARFFLLREAGGDTKVLLDRTYEATAPAAGSTPAAFAAAWGRAWRQVLGLLSEDLKEAPGP